MDNSNQPKPAHKTNWMVIVLLIVIVGIVGVGIYWWVLDTAKINDLKYELAQKGISVTATPTATVTPTATTTVTPTATAADPYAGWRTYRNDYYGFEVRYPKEWQVSNPKTSVMSTKKDEFIDQPHDGILTVFAGPGNFDFHITTQKTNEPFSIGPTGIGWIRTEAGNKVSFSGTEAQKYYQIYYTEENKHSSFHYTKIGQKDSLMFTIGDREYILACTRKSGQEYLNSVVDQKTEDTVDKMVESFRLI